MALFTKKDTIQETKQVGASQIRAARMALKNPRITEKATGAALESVYVFDVSPKATKREILAEVATVYKVSPRKVAIVRIPAKTVRSARTGIMGTKGGGKKAYVYLKKGETISIH